MAWVSVLTVLIETYSSSSTGSMPGSVRSSISSRARPPHQRVSARQVAAGLAHRCEHQERLGAVYDHAVEPEQLQRAAELLLGLRELRV
jgi:hypothetical protein